MVIFVSASTKLNNEISRDLSTEGLHTALDHFRRVSRNFQIPGELREMQVCLDKTVVHNLPAGQKEELRERVRWGGGPTKRCSARASDVSNEAVTWISDMI